MILRFIPRSIHIAEIVNDKLSTSRTVVIRFLEADASVERITAKVKDALSCDEPLTLTDSQGIEIVDSEGTISKLYDQKLASNVVSNILNINFDFKGVIAKPNLPGHS